MVSYRATRNTRVFLYPITKEAKTIGSIYKRGSIYWIKYYRTGKPYRESTQTTKENTAKRLLKLREGQVVEGRFPGLKIERMRFEELTKDRKKVWKMAQSTVSCRP